MRATYRATKKIKILVFGDHLSGKTAFLSSYCDPLRSSKAKKTVGCDIFLLKKGICYDILSKQKEAKFSDNFLFEFWELTGDKSQRQGVNLYFKHQMNEFKGALFFFDCTNLKTLFNFHSWVKGLFDSKTGENAYNCLWDLPFVLIGSKKDRLSKENLKDVRKKVGYYMSSVFKCDNQNIIFLKKGCEENDLDMRIFDLFLNHLCIENELKSKEPSHNSEYLRLMEKVVMVKDTSKYTLDNSYLMNKIKLKMLGQKDMQIIATSSFFKAKEKVVSCCRMVQRFCWCLCRNKEKNKSIV